MTRFVAEHIVVVAVGAILNWLAAFVAARELLGDDPIDFVVFGGAPAILLSVAALACWLPASPSGPDSPDGGTQERGVRTPRTPERYDGGAALTAA